MARPSRRVAAKWAAGAILIALAAPMGGCTVHLHLHVGERHMDATSEQIAHENKAETARKAIENAFGGGVDGG